MIMSGQQARISTDIQILNANIDEAVAWKNAGFLLVDSDIQSLMRKVERWYNVRNLYRRSAHDSFKCGNTKEYRL